jgi:hypothetical protein
MFQLSQAEFRNLKSQIVISSWGGARRARPYAFTEQGVAMLSSVLRSQRAIRVNIAVMRTFVRLREMLTTHKDLARKLAALGTKIRRAIQGRVRCDTRADGAFPCPATAPDRFWVA